MGYASVPARSGAKGEDTAEEAGKDGNTGPDLRCPGRRYSGPEPPATLYEPDEVAAPPEGDPAG
ncbi:hypothetical protein ABZZ36_42155 [Actinacidiphila glaucinigra]|uniref:hypothetical protein n=1 Tax=Actinacidiphila glaucinigra TaxID=235986 RepID=UPI0033BD963C